MRKVVEVDWFAANNIPSTGFGTDPVQSSRQKFAVSFFPTDVVALSSTSILVAGKLRGTETVIEQWTLKWPKTMPLVDASTGEVQVAEPREIFRQEIFRGDIAGKRVVHKMCRMRHSSTAAMVQFDDSSDLYELDLNTGTFTTIAAVTGIGAIGSVPGLADGHQFIWTGDHAWWGYVYVFGTKGEPNDQDDRPDTVVLCDLDRDGTLDTSLSIPVDAWGQSDFSNGLNYIALD